MAKADTAAGFTLIEVVVALAVVAFSEPPVMKDWEAGAIERDSRRLRGTSKIRREDSRESVV